METIAVDENDENARKTGHVRNGNLHLKVGGPAGLFKQRQRHLLCWGLLDACNRTSCHMHFVSFHKKGAGSANRVLNEDLQLLENFQTNYPWLNHLPIANDEADILANWSLNETWRADVYYAAWASSVIISHFKEVIIKRNIPIEVLSNDNAFLNYYPHFFKQRTLLARFQMNNTTPKHVQFIKKPIYVAMALLSLLGDEYIPNLQLREDSIKVLATRRESNAAKVISILIVNENDQANWTSDESYEKFLKINCHIQSNISDIQIGVYSLNNQNTNPYFVWKQADSPDFPNKLLRKQLRDVEGPTFNLFSMNQLTSFSSQQSISNNLPELQLNLQLKLPSINLINICVGKRFNARPEKPKNLRAYFVTTDEVLLVWSDTNIKSRCIRSYEIEYQVLPGNFQRINNATVVLLSYHHDKSDQILPHKTIERYRARAVDYWGRKSAYSNIVDKVIFFANG